MPNKYGQTVGAVLVATAVACSSPATPTSWLKTQSPDPPDQVTGVQMKMAGQVLDDNGRPVPDARVVVQYPSAGGPSIPPSVRCNDSPSGVFCWFATRTDSEGGYSVEFNPRQHPVYKLGYVYTIRDGYESDVQWVPESPSPVIRNMRIRPTRPLVPGGSTVVTLDSMSSLCTDLEDNWFEGARCETVVIESGAGMLTVEARSAAGGTLPAIYWYTTGNYAGRVTWPAPGTAAIPVRAGTFRVMVGIPDGFPTEQFNVTTSLK